LTIAGRKWMLPKMPAATTPVGAPPRETGLLPPPVEFTEDWGASLALQRYQWRATAVWTAAEVAAAAERPPGVSWLTKRARAAETASGTGVYCGGGVFWPGQPASDDVVRAAVAAGPRRLVGVRRAPPSNPTALATDRAADEVRLFPSPAIQRRRYPVALPIQPPYDSHWPWEACG
jgi:hypothetical protein